MLRVGCLELSFTPFIIPCPRFTVALSISDLLVRLTTGTASSTSGLVRCTPEFAAAVKVTVLAVVRLTARPYLNEKQDATLSIRPVIH